MTIYDDDFTPLCSVPRCHAPAARGTTCEQHRREMELEAKSLLYVINASHAEALRDLAKGIHVRRLVRLREEANAPVVDPVRILRDLLDILIAKAEGEEK